MVAQSQDEFHESKSHEAAENSDNDGWQELTCRDSGKPGDRVDWFIPYESMKNSHPHGRGQQNNGESATVQVTKDFLQEESDSSQRRIE